MRKAFLLSLRLHLLWFFEAFSKQGRSIARLTPYRLLVLLLFFPLYLLLQAWNWFGLFLDELFFPCYRQVEINNPLFITGIPRSGTTFIHRTLASDHEQFTTFTTWQALFAPSICQRRLINCLSRFDRSCGRPLHTMLECITRKLTGSMEHIHAIGLHAPEEDYLSLLPAAGCFIMITAFPASKSLWSLGRFDTMPQKHRQVLVSFYKACLQKHLHEAAPGARMLSKNAAFASWLPNLHAAFPDASYILCIRHPQSVLSSQLSSLGPGLAFFATVTAAKAIEVEMQNILAGAYRVVLEETRNLASDRFFIIDQGQLRSNALTLLSKSLQHLDIPISERLYHCIVEASHSSSNHISHHRHNRNHSDSQGYWSFIADMYEEIKSR